jgi:8-oxo-dGTP pyrophosphatase MutT (NUDIX family)
MQLDWISRLRHTLDPVIPPAHTAMEAGISSVLVAVGPHRATGREEILLTKRTLSLGTHKGQISFPGGFWESEDATLIDTALRESREEIGAKAADIEVLGGLAPVRTHQGVDIFPWVGWMDFPYPFALNEAEVERVLFLPLRTLLEQGLAPVTVRVGELGVKSLGIEVDGEMVWGATARILDELRTRLLNSK